MAVDKALISGSMTMLLLRLLAEKDMYGYEMIDTLRKKSCNDSWIFVSFIDWFRRKRIA